MHGVCSSGILEVLVYLDDLVPFTYHLAINKA